MFLPALFPGHRGALFTIAPILAEGGPTNHPNTPSVTYAYSIPREPFIAAKDRLSFLQIINIELFPGGLSDLCEFSGEP